jgi:hypothetical protein
MRRAVPVVVLVVLLAGCGGSKEAPQMSRQQYVAALDKLCSSANQQVAALKLTTSMQTWKQNGQKAARIADQTVKGFKALTPPDELSDAAKSYVSASEGIVTAVTDAANAAKKGDTAKYDDALSRQQNYSLAAREAAGKIGAKACSGG